MVFIDRFSIYSQWSPDGDNPKLGTLIFIVGSTFVSIGAVIISAPISIALAIFMNYISPKNRRKSYYNLL